MKIVVEEGGDRSCVCHSMAPFVLSYFRYSFTKDRYCALWVSQERKKVLTENKTTQKRPKQHRARRKPKRMKKDQKEPAKFKTPRKGSTKGRKGREEREKRKKPSRTLEMTNQATKGSLINRA